jgi:hypothetical protein
LTPRRVADAPCPRLAALPLDRVSNGQPGAPLTKAGRRSRPRPCC